MMGDKAGLSDLSWREVSDSGKSGVIITNEMTSERSLSVNNQQIFHQILSCHTTYIPTKENNSSFKILTNRNEEFFIGCENGKMKVKKNKYLMKKIAK